MWSQRKSTEMEADEFLRLWKEQGPEQLAARLKLSRPSMYRYHKLARNLVTGCVVPLPVPATGPAPVLRLVSPPLAVPESKRPEDVAEFIAQSFGDRLLFNPSLGIWYIFEGTAPTYKADSSSLATKVRRAIKGMVPESMSLDEVMPNLRSIMEADSVRVSKAARMDTNYTLLAFADAVVDLQTGEARPGMPEDLLSKRAPVSYVPYGELSADETARLDRYMRNLWPDDGARRTAISALAGSLLGNSYHKSFYMLYGPPDTGKTSLVELTRLAFGSELVVPFPETVITQKKAIGANTATEWLALLLGARIAVASEPSEGAVKGSAVVKQLTGREEVSWRPLRGKQQRNVFQATLWLQTNHEMELSRDDEGLQVRAKTIDFTARQQRQDRRAFEQELAYLARPFASFLVHCATKLGRARST